MTPGRLLYLARRDLARGWRAAYADYCVADSILDFRADGFSDQRPVEPLHLLTGRDDWRLALWMLASFHYFTRRRWPIIIHDDGTLPVEASEAMRLCFPWMRLVSRAEADARMESALGAFPLCWKYRQSRPQGLKIFDAATFAESERFLLFDGDLLFFARPDEILDWVESRREECRFLRDVAETSNVSAEEARACLGVTPPARVSSGLCLLRRDAIDLSLCEQALEKTGILRGNLWRVEQTLFALCAGRRADSSLMPGTYQVTLAPRCATDAVMRHYVGAVRHRFYGEGMLRLLRALLPPNPVTLS